MMDKSVLLLSVSERHYTNAEVVTFLITNSFLWVIWFKFHPIIPDLYCWNRHMLVQTPSIENQINTLSPLLFVDPLLRNVHRVRERRQRLMETSLRDWEEGCFLLPNSIWSFLCCGLKGLSYFCEGVNLVEGFVRFFEWLRGVLGFYKNQTRKSCNWNSLPRHQKLYISTPKIKDKGSIPLVERKKYYLAVFPKICLFAIRCDLRFHS
jgi:hypothetical protein